MFAVASLLLVLVLSLLAIRTGAAALMMTGMSEDAAQFQSLSAFSGTGFTTSEAERCVTDPVRRAIVARLIRLGSVGVVTAITSLILSLADAGESTTSRLLVILASVIVIIALARSRRLERWLTPLLQRVLARTSSLELTDYIDLLHIPDDYRVGEVEVREGSWLADRRVEELELDSEGVVVLGIVRRGGDYLGTAPREAQLEQGDRLVLYGRKERLAELSRRDAGDRAAHDEARAQHRERRQRQRSRAVNAA